MAVFPGPDNAIVFAQYQLQGGWKRLLSITTGYGVLMGLAILLTSSWTYHFQARDLQGWVAALVVLQIVNFFIFGTFRVESAVRGDVTSRMLESHRLMPVPALGGILGYLFGAPLQMFLLSLINFVLGAVCCSISGLPLDTWVMVNSVLFCCAFFVYTMVVQFAFVARGGFLILLIVSVISITSANNDVLNLLPSAEVLLAPLLSRAAVFNALFNRFGTNNADFTFAYISALIGQAVIALVAMRVAMRRYVSSSVVGISPPLGLTLLATWVGLALLALTAPDSVRMRGFPSNDWSVTQTVSSFSTAMLLALLPIAGAARTARQSELTAGPEGKRRVTSLSVLWTLLAATAIVCALLMGLTKFRPDFAEEALLSAAIVLNFLFSAACLFSWGYRVRRRPWIYVSLWIVLSWLGPVIADAIYRSMADRTDESVTALTALSPPGAIALIWDASIVKLVPGLIGQFGFTLLPALLFLLAGSRARRISA
jgi:hypothetical protein